MASVTVCGCFNGMNGIVSGEAMKIITTGIKQRKKKRKKRPAKK